MAKIAPSVLGADFSRLGEEIKSANDAGVEILHLDIMDGHFVPNISFGPGIVRTIDKLTDAFLDVHLMLSEPEKFFEAFVKAGADGITFHYQVHPQPLPYVEQLRKLGVKTGLSLNPDVPIEKALPWLEHFDLLLLMSVYPGFGGQKFIRDVLPKITTAREHIDQQKLETLVVVDGGVDADNAAEVVTAGAHWLVMGTAFFKSSDRPGLVKLVEQL